MNLEREILHLIEGDAHLSTKAIATMLDVEESEVKAIIQKFEKDKVILGYYTLVNWDRLGNNGVTAMIDVKLPPAEVA